MMGGGAKGVAALMLWLWVGVISAGSHELAGYLAIESGVFAHDAPHPGQENHYFSAVAQPEYYHQWEQGHTLTVVPFIRFDSADPQRSHADLREFNFLYLAPHWELRVGIGKVFWGVTEFVHLVDIINQTDGVENIDGEDKLGQPMINLFLPQAWGNLDLYLLPGFRERTFPGPEGRLRTQVPVSTQRVLWENDAEERHVDLALRYSHTMGDWDLGIYYFRGTGREPDLQPFFSDQRGWELVPCYPQIDQTGLDVQWVAGNWLWKLEALYRHGGERDFFASTGGVEYTFVGIGDSAVDLGVIGEWAYDDRNNDAPTPYEHDLMVGLRLALNDFAGTEVLGGWIKDVTASASYFVLEASRRFGNHWKLALEGWAFIDLPAEDPLFALRRDDHLRFSLLYYF